MTTSTFTAFVGPRRLATGSAAVVAEAVRSASDDDGPMPLVFDDRSGRQVDLDLRGTERVADAPDGEPPDAPARTGARGRPKLGVVAREVTLLPRHWDWLNAQPGGASVALRKLVDAARKEGGFDEVARRSAEAAGRFLTAAAGDLPGYEEATRALYAGDRARFETLTAGFPPDVRDYALALWRGDFA
jgi:hypothetical protein